MFIFGMPSLPSHFEDCQSWLVSTGNMLVQQQTEFLLTKVEAWWCVLDSSVFFFGVPYNTTWIRSDKMTCPLSLWEKIKGIKYNASSWDSILRGQEQTWHRKTGSTEFPKVNSAYFYRFEPKTPNPSYDLKMRISKRSSVPV